MNKSDIALYQEGAFWKKYVWLGLVIEISQLSINGNISFNIKGINHGIWLLSAKGDEDFIDGFISSFNKMNYKTHNKLIYGIFTGVVDKNILYLGI